MKKIDEEAVEFADVSPVPHRSQLLENVFADPKGFGIGPDGRYRCEDSQKAQLMSNSPELDDEYCGIITGKTTGICRKRAGPEEEQRASVL